MSMNPYEALLQGYQPSPETEPGPLPGSHEARAGEWRNVWVWIGRAKQDIFPTSLEVLGKARELADELGVRACAVVFGHGLAANVADVLAGYGADVVYTADAPRFAEFQIDVVREAFVELVESKRPEIVLFPATIQGRNLGAQMAARLETGIVPNCIELRIDTANRRMIQTQRSYGNRLEVGVVTPEAKPQLATVTPGAFRLRSPDPARTAIHEDVTEQAADADPRTSVVGPSPERRPPLQQRDAVLAGGLGLGSRQAFEMLGRLGRLLDAAVVGTRAAVDCGWIPREQLLTRFDLRIHPRLYVGFGVVGDYDHLQAVSEADLIIAVTDDPASPICEMADFVAVGDPAALLEDVVARIEKYRRDRIVVASTDK